MPQDALQSILTEAGLALTPLRAVNTPARGVEFFRKLGYEIPSGAFGSALPGVAAQAGELIAAVRALTSATGEGGVAAAIVNLLARLVAAIDAIRQLHQAIQSGGGGSIPQIGNLPRRLTDFLILDYLNTQRSQAHAVLHVLGLIEHEPTPAAGQSSRLINWERFAQFLTEPQRIANDVYQWDSTFDAEKFLKRLEALMRAAVLPGGLYPQADTTRTILGNTSTNLQELRFPLLQKGFTPETYAQFGITFSPAEAQGPKKKGIGLLPYIMGAADFQFGVCDRGELVFEASADIKGVGLVVRPPFNAEGILNLTGGFGASIQIRQKPERTEEIIIIGSSGGSRLAVQGLGVTWFARNPQGKLDVGVEAEVQALRLVIEGGEGDGFLSTVLSGLHVEAEANLALGVALLSGFTFRGGAKLALEIPTHIDLGPLKIEGLRLALAPTAEELTLEAGALFKLELGPLQAVVENMGIKAALQFEQGNLGPANLELAFKPPNGVGLSLDVGTVKGGGYLYFDFDREEYAGALELSIMSFVTVKAIALITTRMPDGSKGFSLLIIISAQFTGIQLGFGFVLTGLGGLLGLNRTMQLEAIAQGVRTGGINSIMFPEDVIANAPRIISDLRLYFPPQEGRFLIGLMAQIGWGTPTLATLSLGVIIEIPPGKLAILGILKVALPADDAALIVIQVNFIGAIEPDKERLWFFAELFESRVLFISIEGGMGLLVAWGDNANFVLSVGGFHPRFSPPPLPFPVPNRIALDILNTPVSRIRVEAYFAVTSNTVQFGARVELRLGFDEIGIFGHLAFDALFQFSPFYFIIEISGSVELKVFGLGLFSIRLEFSLEGPTPWRARGTGTLSLLFFDISADFDITWGDREDTSLPPIPVLPLLETEFNKVENWRAELPKGGNLLVSLRAIEETAGLVLHPVGTLVVSQRGVPLGINIAKVGSQKVADAKHFTVKTTTTGLGKKGDRKEQFAMGQFLDLPNSEKLSRKAYELQNSGLELSTEGRQTVSSRSVKRIVRYEMIVIDSKYKREIIKFFGYARTLFTHFLRGNAAAQSPLSYATQKMFVPFEDKVKVQQEGYVVATNFDNKPVNSSKTFFESEAAAYDFMRAQASANPDLGEVLHVIPAHEGVTD